MARTRRVTYFVAGTHIVITNGALKPVRIHQKTLMLPVHHVTDGGHDVVQLPNGTFLELP